MFRFLTGFIFGFISVFFILQKKNQSSENKNQQENLSPFFKEDPYRIINIMKEFQKMKEKI